MGPGDLGRPDEDLLDLLDAPDDLGSQPEASTM